MDKKVLRWNFIFQYGYVLTNMINSFVLLPFYVGYIDEVQLGLWWATGNVLAWLTLSDPGIGDVLQQKIAQLSGKGDREEIAKTIGSGIIATFCTFVISLIIGIGFYFVLEGFLNINLDNYQDLKWAFLISVLSTGITLVTFALAGINQGMMRSKHVAISYIMSNVIFFVVNLILLQLGFQLMSIAIASAVRALFLVFYNLIVLLVSKDSSNQGVIFAISHFKRFIRIFSYTSLSKIITSFSNNIDLIILARFIPPQAITLFEINRRPIKMSQSLLGRYSVALMPSISFEAGKNTDQVKQIVQKQFRIFLLMTMMFTGLSILCYKQLITLWMGESNYAGNTVLLLLAGNFFFALIGYFLSNITYAIGDIKRFSLVTGIKGALLLVFFPFAAILGGITGVLILTLVTSVAVDFGYFAYRLNKLGYLNYSTNQLVEWIGYFGVLVIAFTITYFGVWASGVHSAVLSVALYVLIFVLLFFTGLVIIDSRIKQLVLQYIKR